MVLGEDGIIGKAREAAEKTKEAEKQTQEDLKNLMDEIDDILSGKAPDTLQEAVEKQKVFLRTTKYDSSGNKIDESSEDPAKVPAITIPAGFKIIEGDLSSINDGIVIVDGVGNEFVWVPCTETQYKMHNYSTRADKNDEGHNLEDANEGGWNTWYYTKYEDWKGDPAQETKNLESVKNNGGFYIARYEAGIPSSAPFYVDASTELKTYANSSQKNTSNYVPVSQKGKQAWNYINQTNAKAASEKMYAGNGSVSSQLVDGIAWDRTVDWIVASGKYQHTGTGDAETSESIEKDSTTKGNYKYNYGGITENNILWAEHVYADELGWCIGKSYKYGKFTSGYIATYTGPFDDFNNYNSDSKYSYEKYVEMATGASENTKLNNIYDLAGNMHEWTTERGSHKDASNINQDYARKTCAVFRGGSFNSSGSSNPVSIRIGLYDVGTTGPNVSFRVVLYIK